MKDFDSPNEEHILIQVVTEMGNELYLDTDVMQGVLDAFPFYVMLVDSDHYILLANKAIGKQFDIDQQEIIGSYCPKVIHGIDHPFPGCPLEEAVQKGKSIERELFDNKIPCWFNSAVYPTRFHTQEGKAIFLHSSRDITSTKEAEIELDKYRDHLEELVQDRTEHLKKIVNLMAGREVRMAELKKVIKKLREQLVDSGIEPIADDPLLNDL